MTHLFKSAETSIFSPEISKFCSIRKYKYRLHFGTKFLILLTFFESLINFLINMVTILMMSAKLATPGPFKIRTFQNKGYGVMILDYYVTNNIISRDSSYFVDAIMWQKFGNSSISRGEVIITSILQGFDQKNHFFEGWSWFKFNNLAMVLGMTLKFYTSVAKGLKLKARKFCGLTPPFVEVTGEKLVGLTFLPHSWIGLRNQKQLKQLLTTFLQNRCS